jgi:hypothetical protein
MKPMDGNVQTRHGTVRLLSIARSVTRHDGGSLEAHVTLQIWGGMPEEKRRDLLKHVLQSASPRGMSVAAATAKRYHL